MNRDGRGVLLLITDAGRAALGLEPAGAPVETVARRGLGAGEEEPSPAAARLRSPDDDASAPDPERRSRRRSSPCSGARRA